MGSVLDTHAFVLWGNGELSQCLLAPDNVVTSDNQCISTEVVM
jgi:hypothetical protein